MTGSNESESLFIVTCATSTIIDVWVDIVLMDGPGMTATTTNSASSGYFYVTYLDGPQGSGVFIPQSVVAIF
jgi:hypothetical protein